MRSVPSNGSAGVDLGRVLDLVGVTLLARGSRLSRGRQVDRVRCPLREKSRRLTKRGKLPPDPILLRPPNIREAVNAAR
jgi:hypothetical protein